jgi:hypothetical protein
MGKQLVTAKKNKKKQDYPWSYNLTNMTVKIFIFRTGTYYKFENYVIVVIRDGMNGQFVHF